MLLSCEIGYTRFAKRASEETNVPGHLRILLLAIGAVCCMRSQRGAVTLCVSASQVLIPVESHYVNGLWLSRTIPQNSVRSSLHRTPSPSPCDLDLPLRREFFVFRCSSRYPPPYVTLPWYHA